MLVGFVHGVMNTDNMTISGETIDYGPCAFMDTFDPKTVFSSIDSWGRYAYGNQPTVAGWNLARLAEALLPLIADDQDQGIALATASLQDFPRRYAAAWTAGMREKLGLPEDVDDKAVAELADDLLGHLEREPRRLHIVLPPAEPRRPRRRRTGRPLPTALHSMHGSPDGGRLVPDAEAMDRVNPVYIPRNHLVEEALAAATADDMGPLEQLLAAITSPYEERAGFERYAEPAPEDFGAATKPSAALSYSRVRPGGEPGRAPPAAARP